jgi:L-cysteine:1D-myo-inositol 2-amino-2-deoxy-alpha-D-glucopyranoside ligase
MKLYNTLTQNLDTFIPEKQPVTLYVCGITPYDTTHLGHAFTYSTADIMARYLEYQGNQVHYVQNVTDIDDDILKKAKQVDEDWRSLVNRWTRHFIEDLKAINVRPPDHFPRATSVIPSIIRSVQDLLNAGVAYEAGGSVYFSIDRWPDYGKLSRLSREEMLPVANERGNNPDDPNKQNPLDFVLWQAQAPGEPFWDSPWGPGRPGWHIECSTMSTCLLDETIDLHMGGGDLVYPHHESEIAQVEPVTGKSPFVKVWMHVAMVRHEGEKMSKSLGNLVMVRDLLKTWTPDTLRLFLASHHYRHSWEYDEARLYTAADLDRQLTAAAGAESGELDDFTTSSFETDFQQALENDLDTPTALGVLGRLASAVMDGVKNQQDVRQGQELLRKLGGVFGLRLGADSPSQRVLEGWNRHLKGFE